MKHSSRPIQRIERNTTRGTVEKGPASELQLDELRKLCVGKIDAALDQVRRTLAAEADGTVHHVKMLLTGHIEHPIPESGRAAANIIRYLDQTHFLGWSAMQTRMFHSLWHTVETGDSLSTAELLTRTQTTSADWLGESARILRYKNDFSRLFTLVGTPAKGGWRLVWNSSADALRELIAAAQPKEGSV